MMAELYRKYHITKTDGSPIDPAADYFVLRLDSGEYVDACRAALHTFCVHIETLNPELVADLETHMIQYDLKCPHCRRALKEGDSIEIPPLYCPECGDGWDYPAPLPVEVE